LTEYIFAQTNQQERNIMAKLEQLIIENFPSIIFSFAVFWLALISYGLLNQ